MAIDVQRNTDARVAKALAHDLCRDACQEQEGGACVLEIVDANLPKTRCLHNRRKRSADVVGVDRGALRGADDQVVFLPGVARCLLLESLPIPMLPEHGDRCSGKVNRSGRGCGFGLVKSDRQ